MGYNLTNLNFLLLKALHFRNIRDFRAALKLGADPLADSKGYFYCVFGQALETYGCVEFVEACLKAGCSPRKEIFSGFRNLCPIYLAAKSGDTQIINAVFSYNKDNVNIVDLEGLNIVMDSEDEIDEFKKLEIVQQFLTQLNLDIDTLRSDELRVMLAEKYPNLKYHLLSTYIRMGDMDKFQQKFLDTQRNTTEQENEHLLYESILTGRHLAFDLLMKSGVNYNRISDGKNLALYLACCIGNWYVLEKLLQQPDILFGCYRNPLIFVICQLNNPPSSDFCDLWKCFNILLKSNKININSEDELGITALHCAVQYGNNEAIKQLLKKGADISIKTYLEGLILAIARINPEILEEHFDSCISSNGLKSEDDKYEIRINFRNLRPEKNKNWRFHDDMTPMVHMANNKEFHCLLLHPVITSFLFLKWQKLSLLFYVNFILYLFYAISIMIHVVFKFRLTDHTTALAVTEIMTWLGICYLIIRETVQFIMGPIRYVSLFTNYMEVTLIILSVITCIEHHFFSDIQREIAVVTILLAAVEIMQLVGSLPVTSISTHMLMLVAVSKSFLKSFLFYSIFVITFALCFYITSDHVSETDEKAFNKFTTPMVAFLKTIVMLTGELDAADFKLEFFHSLLFVIFLLCMPIIMMNLLNGLAVNDTQEIKAQAELNFIICRINLLTRYEIRDKQTKLIFDLLNFHALSKYWNYLFPDIFNGKASQISILPNRYNEIQLREKNYNESQETTDSSSSVNIPLTKEEEIICRRHLSLQDFIFRKYVKMDYRTVKLAKIILERNAEIKKENHLKQKQDEMSKNMSEQLAVLERKLENNMENRLEQKPDELLKQKSETNMENRWEQQQDEISKRISEQSEQKSETNMENRWEQQQDKMSKHISEQLAVLERKLETNMGNRLEQKLDETFKLLKRMSEQNS